MAEVMLKDQKEFGALSIPNPQEFIATVTNVADALKSVVEKQKLYADICGKKFVTCEGWTTLASLCGFIPSIQSIEITKENGVIEAKAEAVLTKKGVIIAKAIAFCRSDEEKFSGKRMQEKYEVASMAQTRAVSKVCRIALSWIMTMAGYEATPAEEVKAEYVEAEVEKKEDNEKITEPQMRAIFAITKKINFRNDEEKMAKISEIVGREVKAIKDLTKSEASKVIDALQREPF